MKPYHPLLLLALLLSSCQEQSRVSRSLAEAEHRLWSDPAASRLILEGLPVSRYNVCPWTYAYYHLLLAQTRSRTMDTSGNDTLLDISARYYEKMRFFTSRHYRMRCELYRADHYLDLDSLSLAAHHLKAAEYLTDKHTPVQYRQLLYGSLGYLNRKNGLFDQALDYYSRSVNLFPVSKDTVWLLNDLSSMLNIPGYDTTSIAREYPLEWQLSYIRCLPSRLKGKFWQNLGVWYNDHGQPHPAENCLREALMADSTRHSTRLTLAKLYESRGETAQADSLYRYLLYHGTFYQKGTVWHQLYRRALHKGHADSAAVYLHRYEICLDSLYKTRDFARIQSIQARYDRQALETKLWKNKFYTMVIVAVLVFIIILIRYVMGHDLKRQKQQVFDGRIRYSLLLGEKETLSLTLIAHEKSINQYKVIYQIPAHEMHLEKEDLKALNFFKHLHQPGMCYDTDQHYHQLKHWCNLLYDGFADKLQTIYPMLTPSDMEICCLLRMGYTLEDMCELFHSTPDTIRKRMQRMYKFFGVTTRQAFILKITTFA